MLTLILPIRPRIFSSVIEESLIVVGGLQRRDLGGDEVVEFCKVLNEVGWKDKVHFAVGWIGRHVVMLLAVNQASLGFL